jgi:MFS family permease
MQMSARKFFAKFFPTENQLHLWGPATIIDKAGNGFLLTIEIIYLTKFLHFSAVKVGLGFSIATILALPSTFIAGHRSQHGNNRNRYANLMLLLAATLLGYAFVSKYWQFLALSIINSFASNSAGTFRGVLMNSQFTETQERVNFRSHMRGFTNFGIGLGSGLASLALIFEQMWIMRVLILLDAASFILNAYLFKKITVEERVVISAEENKENRWVAVKDPHYVTATLLGSIFMTHFTFQAIGIPLWVIYYTHAPHWSIAAILVLNTVACVVFAKTFTKKGNDIAHAARKYFWGSFAILAAMFVYALAHKANPVVATLVLLAGMGLHVVGELAGVSAGWSLSLSMMQERFMGQYQGLWQLTFNLSAIIGPTMITYLIVHYQAWGMIAYGAIVTIAGALFIPLTKSYLRKSPSLTSH